LLFSGVGVLLFLVYRDTDSFQIVEQQQHNSIVVLFFAAVLSLSARNMPFTFTVTELAEEDR
jgi:Na+/H+ antiporter NhaD/arsenite permease-like protein